jgi:alpha-beta hydrolase superfamily lysophospholipase
MPVLVLTSDHSVHPTTWEPAVDESDIVLDVNLMGRWAFKLGSHVTVVRVPGALHDVTLSHQPARDRVFDEIDHWLSAYL